MSPVQHACADKTALLPFCPTFYPRRKSLIGFFRNFEETPLTTNQYESDSLDAEVIPPRPQDLQKRRTASTLLHRSRTILYKYLSWIPVMSVMYFDQGACWPCSDEYVPPGKTITNMLRYHFDSARALGLSPKIHVRAPQIIPLKFVV